MWATRSAEGVAPLVVTWRGAEAEGLARAIAARLAAPLVDELPADEGLAVVVGKERVELRATGKGAPGPVWVDLTGGRLLRQRKEPGLKRQPLGRALGLHKPREGGAPFVVDATGGLAKDAALLVFMGCRVLLVERSPVLAVLLEDGLARAHEDPDVGPVLEAALTFVEGDSRAVLERLLDEGQRPDAVYLDPMFPERRKSALVKKEMQVLQRLHGEPKGATDDAALLEVARRAARERVVVKRPKGAPDLGPGVSFRVPGDTVRFDVYLPAPSAPG